MPSNRNLGHSRLIHRPLLSKQEGRRHPDEVFLVSELGYNSHKSDSKESERCGQASDVPRLRPTIRQTHLETFHVVLTSINRSRRLYECTSSAGGKAEQFHLRVYLTTPVLMIICKLGLFRQKRKLNDGQKVVK